MADSAKAIEAIRESKPPATDPFTYLALIHQFASPDILPTLNELLQDAELTQKIGWDLIGVLLPIAGCEECLETIARLGNPREAIIKVLEVLEEMQTGMDENTASELEVEKFITLLGMLAILHKRIQTKYPSRFLASTLQTVYGTYRPNEEMTAAVINLVHSLSGQKRPALPKRQSSINVANPDHDGDTSKNAPDPEAEQEDPTEEGIQRKLLLSFVTCVLDVYVNGNSMQWSPRLLEFYNPDKMVPGKKTALEAFRQNTELSAKDGVIGSLAALSRDLGLASCSATFIQHLCEGPVHKSPLLNLEDIQNAGQVHLSTSGVICLLAYWVFSSAVFEADSPTVEMHIMPSHASLIDTLLQESAEEVITLNPGTIDALVAIGLWLQDNGLVSATSDAADFGAYHHYLTLCAVFHPSLAVRNAATSLAGLIIHDDPDDGDRVKILDDLLENCMFASLRACALTWLREEIILAHKRKLENRFATPDAVDTLQYAIYQDMSSVKTMDAGAFLETWANSGQFHLQAANLALFLFTSENYRDAVPSGMAAAVQERYSEPLVAAAQALEEAISKGEVVGDGLDKVKMEMQILADTLARTR